MWVPYNIVWEMEKNKCCPPLTLQNMDQAKDSAWTKLTYHTPTPY